MQQIMAILARYLLSALLWSSGAAFVAPAAACTVPVFRYALEHWAADPYTVVVFYDGRSAHASIDALAQFEGWANVQIHSADVSALDDAELRTLWRRQSAATLPWMVVRYPNSSPAQGAIWAGPADPHGIQSLLDSPARRTIARRLLRGDAAVWVLLESGDRVSDDVAAALLETELTKLQATLKLPQPTDETAPAEMQIAFSLLRLSRTDPAERPLVAMLLGSEPDLRHYATPIAFPIYGRGRALYALVGPGINSETIRDACAFLTGACSCQVKQQNPGVDLLMAVDWAQRLDRPSRPQPQPQPVQLTSPARFAVAGSAPRSTPSPAAASPAGPLIRNLWITLLIGLTLAVGGAGALIGIQRARRRR